jgi:predicted nuclease of restriction endonuclease-like RecB superfamily
MDAERWTLGPGGPDAAMRRIVPRYLTEQDHVWLAALLDEFERHIGRRRQELRERLSEPLATSAPASWVRLAARVLEREYGDATRAAVSPVKVRRAAFGAAAGAPDRRTALETAGASLGLSPEGVLPALFADLPSERILTPPSSPFGPAELALRTNHSMIASLLKKASHVRITAEGEVRALVRAAKVRGLLCTAAPAADGRLVTLDISGPYALFRHTLVYGRALASLVPRAARCPRFELIATCILDQGRKRGELVVRSGDPVVPAAALAAFDSKVEQRFAREFARAAPDWDVIREPEAVPTKDGFLFPDFLLRHRRWGSEYLLEIMGFWTEEYVEQKLAKLRAANLDRFILCIDENRNCSDGKLPPRANVIRYRRSVPVTEVLRIVERTPV